MTDRKQLRIGQVVIVNDVEQPCSRMASVIFAIEGDCVWTKYLADLKAFDNWAKKGASNQYDLVTPIEDFGVRLRVDATQYWCEPVGASVATYPDGAPRRWQEHPRPLSWKFRPSAMQLVAMTADWSETNRRRVELIHKKVARTISSDERTELNHLQSLATSRKNLIAPLPMAELERIHREVVRPWDARAAELEPIEGPYCVYAAWKEWVEAWNEKQSENMQLDLDSIDKTVLFSAFQAATGKHQSEPAEVA